MREHRKRIDRLQNLLIAVLVCTALVLINQTGMFRNLTGGSAGTPVEASFTGVQDTALSRQAPVALLIQTSSGRYGVQYDQDTVDGLYNNGLSTLLTTAIDHVEGVKTTTEEDWQDAVTQGNQWIFYDFLYDVAFTGQDSEGEGSARRFLLSGRNGRVDTIRYYNEKTGTYYRGQIRESDLTLPEAQEGLTPSGGQLAFENVALAESLDPNTLVLPKAPVCPVYTVTNPLAAWDSETRNELLEGLDFNLRAAAVDQHHPHAQQGQGDQVVHDGQFQLIVDHSVAAVLDDKCFAVVFLDIGRSFAEKQRHLFIFHCTFSPVPGLYQVR